jgi:hypothetical protein
MATLLGREDEIRLERQRREHHEDRARQKRQHHGPSVHREFLEW